MKSNSSFAVDFLDLIAFAADLNFSVALSLNSLSATPISFFCSFGTSFIEPNKSESSLFAPTNFRFNSSKLICFCFI